MPQLSINYLPNHLLISIFRRIPNANLLHLELVCHRWKLIQELVCCEIRTLVLLGPSTTNNTNLQPSTPYELIQKCHQRYSISIWCSFRHVTLPSKSKGCLTRSVCEYLLRKFPNISRLELVQISLKRSIDYLLFLLNGWNLVQLTLLQDEPVEFFPKVSKFSLSPHFSKLSLNPSKRHQNSLHRLLAHLSPNWQPYLRSLTLVTFDDLSQKFLDCQFDLSHLEELNFVRPWDCNRLLTQVLLDSFQYPHAWLRSMRRLTLYSDSNFSSTFIRDPAHYPSLQALFMSLTHLTVNFTNRTLLYLIKESCFSLRMLHLSAVNLPLIDLALELEPLQFRLTHLRLTYPSQCLDRHLEWKAIQDPFKIPLFVTVRQLHLTFSTLLHSPEIATPILEHLFPKLERLILDRNKVEQPTNGASCSRCVRMRQTAFSCKYKLIQSLGCSSLTSMRGIHIEIETSIPNNSKMFNQTLIKNQSKNSSINPKCLQEYEVFCYKQKRWNIEARLF